MKITPIAESTAIIEADKVVLATVNDAVNLIGNSRYSGIDNIIINEANIRSTFFDLKTGLAGEVLQKFSTYNMRLAIIGNFIDVESKSLKDFIYESNKRGQIIFTDSVEKAVKIFNNPG